MATVVAKVVMVSELGTAKSGFIAGKRMESLVIARPTDRADRGIVGVLFFPMEMSRDEANP